MGSFSPRRGIVGPLVLAIVAGCSSPSVSQDRPAGVGDAIRRGSDYLERHYRDANPSPADHGDHGVGTAALAGIALLESGVKPDNPTLAKIAGFIRGQAFYQTKTYEIALSAMFLERLGEPEDRAAIQYLGIRLLFGQGPTGGWSYDCGEPLPPAEAHRLTTRTGGADEPPAKEAPPKKVDPNKPVPVVKPKEAAKPDAAASSSGLSPEVEKYLRLVNPRGNPNTGIGDNSNTQFAIVGLWCARRAGLKCDFALQRTEARFRKSQCGDGGWAYDVNETTSTPSMTCAGLMGIALGEGVNPNRAANLRTGDAPVPVGKEAPRSEVREKIKDPALLRGLARLEAAVAQNRQGGGSNLADNLYFMWSLERVGMALGLETIGQLDWYRWGSEQLVRSQQADGRWPGGGYPGARDELSTCFALLFLNRTNLTSELTKSLKTRPDLLDKATAPKGSATTPASNVPVPVRREPAPVPAPTDDAGFDREANRLCQKLLKASAADRRAVLDELRDTKGSVYTEALVRAAGQGPASMLEDIREALALRLKRMTRATLQEMLKDPNREVRRGAAKAAGLKGDAELVSSLIDALTDLDAGVVQAARGALVSLSGGRDFGPADGAGAEERQGAAEKWRAWKK